MFFIFFFHFSEEKVSFFFLVFLSKIFLLLALVSEFNCFLRSRCSMEMWCPDDKGRDSWDWVGPPASPEWVEAPRLLKRSLSRLYYCCCYCCCFGCWWWWWCWCCRCCRCCRCRCRCRRRRRRYRCRCRCRCRRRRCRCRCRCDVMVCFFLRKTLFNNVTRLGDKKTPCVAHPSRAPPPIAVFYQPSPAEAGQAEPTIPMSTTESLSKCPGKTISPA